MIITGIRNKEQVEFTPEDWVGDDNLDLFLINRDTLQVRSIWHNYFKKGKPSFPPVQDDEDILVRTIMYKGDLPANYLDIYLDNSSDHALHFEFDELGRKTIRVSLKSQLRNRVGMITGQIRAKKEHLAKETGYMEQQL